MFFIKNDVIISSYNYYCGSIKFKKNNLPFLLATARRQPTSVYEFHRDGFTCLAYELGSRAFTNEMEI